MAAPLPHHFDPSNEPVRAGRVVRSFQLPGSGPGSPDGSPQPVASATNSFAPTSAATAPPDHGGTSLASLSQQTAYSVLHPTSSANHHPTVSSRGPTTTTTTEALGTAAKPPQKARGALANPPAAVLLKAADLEELRFITSLSCFTTPKTLRKPITRIYRESPEQLVVFVAIDNVIAARFVMASDVIPRSHAVRSIPELERILPAHWCNVCRVTNAVVFDERALALALPCPVSDKSELPSQVDPGFFISRVWNSTLHSVVEATVALSTGRSDQYAGLLTAVTAADLEVVETQVAAGTLLPPKQIMINSPTRDTPPDALQAAAAAVAAASSSASPTTASSAGGGVLVDARWPAVPMDVQTAVENVDAVRMVSHGPGIIALGHVAQFFGRVGREFVANLLFGLNAGVIDLCRNAMGGCLISYLVRHGTCATPRILERVPWSVVASRILSDVVGSQTASLMLHSALQFHRSTRRHLDPIAITSLTHRVLTKNLAESTDVADAEECSLNSVASNAQSCRVLQLVVEACVEVLAQHAAGQVQATSEIVASAQKLVNALCDLAAVHAADPWSNYATQSLISACTLQSEDSPVTVAKGRYFDSLLARVLVVIRPHLERLSCHKSGSNVIEKLCAARPNVTAEVAAAFVDIHGALQRLAADRFGNYVLQTMLQHLPAGCPVEVQLRTALIPVVAVMDPHWHSAIAIDSWIKRVNARAPSSAPPAAAPIPPTAHGQQQQQPTVTSGVQGGHQQQQVTRTAAAPPVAAAHLARVQPSAMADPNVPSFAPPAQPMAPIVIPSETLAALQPRGGGGQPPQQQQQQVAGHPQPFA